MRRGDVHQALFNEQSRRIAPWLLVASFLLPPKGLGFTICAFKALTHLPCPACGLGRSVSSLSHLHFADSVRFHPFGWVVYGLLVLLVVASVMGEERRDRVRKWLDRHHRGAALGYTGLIYSFVGFGVVRLGLSLAFPGWFADV